MVEIGAGLGSLTLALAEAGARVVAVEVDRGLVPVLREVVASRSVRVVEADALRLDWAELLGAGRPDGRWWPTCPTTWPRRWWCGCSRRRPQVRSLLVMVQREVGERMAAVRRRPGLRRGVGEGRLLGHGARWSAGCPPRSSCPGRRWSRRSSASSGGPSRPCRPPWSATSGCSRWCGPASRQRRKMLRRSLAGVVEPAAFAAAGVAPEARAEELDVEAVGEAGPMGRMSRLVAPAKLTRVAPGPRPAARRLSTS